jgi:hypothetical protein
MSQEETSCHRKKPPVTRRNLQSREETSFDRKKPPVTLINIISQEETSCHTKQHKKIDIQMDEHIAEEKIEITENVPLLWNIYNIFKNTMSTHGKENSERNTICHRKKPPVTRRNLHSREETSCDRKRPPVKVRTSYHRKELPVTRRSI